jgi:hypothetical protein
MNERTTYNPAARYTERYQNPSDPRLYPDAGHRAALALGAFILAVIIVVVTIALSTHSTATGPSATQRSTGQAGTPSQH